MENKPNVAPMDSGVDAPIAAPVVVSTPTSSPLTADSGTKSYLVMVILAFFAGVTGLARAYRGEKVGWVRFWMYIGSTVAAVVPFLNILAGLLLIVLYIWGVVDFFLVYRLRDDAEGKPLHATPRDQKWAGIFNVMYIIGLALAVVFIILGIIFSAAIMSNIGNYSGVRSDTSLLDTSTNSSSSSSSSSSNSNATEVLSNYADLANGISRSEAESILGVTPSDSCSEYSYGDSKSETCSYGGYDEGYSITLGFSDNKLNSKSKYEY